MDAFLLGHDGVYPYIAQSKSLPLFSFTFTFLYKHNIHIGIPRFMHV